LGGRYDADALAEAALTLWPSDERPFIICTGGEPMMQLSESIIAEMRARGCEIAIETNGTIPVAPGIDWIAVSPKPRAELRQQSGNELKLLFPLEGMEPTKYECLDFQHFYLQPIDGDALWEATAKTIGYCLAHPKWKLSLQMHKLAGFR
jgi:organic radical activating enzyme